MAGRSPQDYLKSFACGQCGAPQQVRGLGMTTTMACSSCGSVIDVSNPSYQILQRASGVMPKLEMQLILGSRCSLRGAEYEVIGYMERTDSSGEYRWGEYLLLNPYLGFVWLIDNQGHWSLIRMTKVQPALRGNLAQYHGRRFRKFLADSARVSFVLGEFYWRVKVGDQTSSLEYIAPPYILAAEGDEDEVVWSVGEYIDQVEIRSAFKSKQRLKSARGIAANQPNPWSRRLSSLMLPWVSTIILSTLIFLLRWHDHRELASQHYLHPGQVLSQTAEAKVLEPIIIGPRPTNVGLSLEAPVDNSWLAAELTLVNVTTKEVKEANVEVSYYHGIEDGEAWSEGGQQGRTLFSQVEPGTYTLTLSSESSHPRPIMYTVRVIQDIRYWGNLGVVLFVVSIFPLWCLLRALSFEHKRWANSSYGSD